MTSLGIWTIYDHPEDYPDHFVARKWEVNRLGPYPTDSVLIDTDLDALRKKLPVGLYCLPRRKEDDPVIVETWV